MPQPQRTEGGHRQYSQRDIDSLKWLIARQAEGVSISHAVELWRALEAEGEDPLLQQDEIAFPEAPRADAPQLGTEMTDLRHAWVTACLAFDRVTAEQVLARAFALFPPEIVSVELLQASLAEIGELWYEGEISVQQEHFTSAMSVQRLEMLIAAAPPPMRPERIIVASAQDDFHVFSPLLLTYLLRRRGWDVLYLGADVPVAELEKTVSQTEPQMLIISAQLLSTAASLVDVAAALSGHDTAVGYGGLVFNLMPQLQERIPAHFLGPTIEGAVAKVEQLLRQHPPHPPAAQSDQIYSQALQQFDEQHSLLESHLWASYAASGEQTDQLVELNLEMAGIIRAALIFGGSDILKPDMQWLHYLMTSYRLSKSEAQEYIDAYFRAASVHLGETAQMIVNWLAELSSNQ